MKSNILQNYAVAQGFNPEEFMTDYFDSSEDEQLDMMAHIMQVGGMVEPPTEQPEAQDQIMQLVQAYCQATGQDPQAVVEQLQQLPEQEQQAALQQMAQAVQQGQQQAPQMQTGGYDKVSLQGYSDNSPYRMRNSNLIKSPYITMANTGKDLIGISDTGDTKFMPAYSGDYKFDGSQVTEIPYGQTNYSSQLDQLLKKSQENIAKAKKENASKIEQARLAAIDSKLRGYISDITQGIPVYTPRGEFVAYKPISDEAKINLIEKAKRLDGTSSTVNNSSKIVSPGGVEITDKSDYGTWRSFKRNGKEYTAYTDGDVYDKNLNKLIGNFKNNKFLKQDTKPGDPEVKVDKSKGNVEVRAGNPSTGSNAIKKEQAWLNKNTGTNLVVDGILGNKTKAARAAYHAGNKPLINTPNGKLLPPDIDPNIIDDVRTDEEKNRDSQIGDPLVTGYNGPDILTNYGNNIDLRSKNPKLFKNSENPSYRFRTNNLLGTLGNNFKVSQAFRQAALPYMEDVDARRVDQNFIDPRPGIQTISDQVNNLASSINPNSTTGQAVLSNLAGREAEAISDLVNRTAVQNQQIAYQNKASNAQLYNNLIQGRNRANANYYDTYLRNQAARDSGIDSAIVGVQTLANQQMNKENYFNEIMQNNANVSDTTSLLDRLLGKYSYTYDKQAANASLNY